MLNIVYEDNNLMIINKPAGIVSHHGAGNESGTLSDLIIEKIHANSLLEKAGLVHRLDKETSGLLLVSKNQETLTALQDQMKARLIKREYIAIVRGKLISGGTINTLLSRDKRNRQKMSANNDYGKNAITHYRISEKYRHHTLINVTLETGRTHQIRVHMAHIGYPIIGDKKYFNNAAIKGMDVALLENLQKLNRNALHAIKLSFLHPVENIYMSFEAEIPKELKVIIELLRKDIA